MQLSLNFISISLIILSIAVIALIGIIVHLHLKLKKFLIGSSSGNLDESINSINSSLRELENFKAEMEKYLLTVEKRVRKSVQAVHTVRFNPFKGTGSGGNQSFATAFLNEERDGVIISSLYARDHVSVFSKSVENGVSQHELSEEEKNSLEGAKKYLPK